MGGTKPIVEGIRQCLKEIHKRPFNYECLVYNDKQRKLGTYYIKINKLTN
jgi:predicted nuclease of restriction endonuclease-like (RecB) superfamily